MEVNLNGDAQSLLWHLNLVDAALGKIGEEKVEKVQSLLKSLEDHMQTECAKVDRLFEESTKEPKVTWTKPLQKAIEVFHPEARRFLDLIIGLDKMMVQLAHLWFAKIITNGQYYQMKSGCRQVLKDAAKRIAKLV